MRRTMGLHLARVLAASVAFCVCAASASAQVCPPSEWSFTTISGWQATTAAEFDTSSGMTGAIGGVRCTIRVPEGELGVYRCCGLGIAATKLVDDFDVQGVPAGTPVTAIAELEMDGWILGGGCGGSGCWGNLRGTVTTPSGALSRLLTANVFAVDSVHVSDTVSLPLTFTAGSPARIEFLLEAFKSAGGNNGAHGVGRIHFGSLPAGVRVVSCKGYASDATPARATTWGTLKQLYR